MSSFPLLMSDSFVMKSKIIHHKKDIKMQAFESNFENVVKRFFLMMAVVLIGGFSGQWWLAVLALPIFLSAILSVSFFPQKEKEGKEVRMKSERKAMKKAS